MKQMRAQPLGPPVPPNGWRVALADDFNVPFGEPLWHLNRDSCPDADLNYGGFNGTEVQVFNRSAISHEGSLCNITASYHPGVAPPTGNGSGSSAQNYVERNYISGCMTTAPVGLTRRGFLWLPGQGDHWAFECVCKWPQNIDGEIWAGFWTAGPVDGWQQERDFIEMLPAQGAQDCDWIYQTTPKQQDWYSATLGFDPAADFHTYTYVIAPDQSWQYFIDGVLQSWVGDAGTAPARTSSDIPMQVILSYSLRKNSWTEGSQVFAVDSVGIYNTSGQHFTGGGIAKGTTVT